MSNGVVNVEMQLYLFQFVVELVVVVTFWNGVHKQCYLRRCVKVVIEFFISRNGHFYLTLLYKIIIL